MLAMKFTALVTILSVVLTFVFSGRVGGYRGKGGIAAPATSGSVEFERAFRVHYNTIEQLVIFLPVLWLSTPVIGDVWAAALGGVWLIGRLLYASEYMKDPASRAPGMFMTVIPTGILAVASLWGVFRQFF